MKLGPLATLFVNQQDSDNGAYEYEVRSAGFSGLTVAYHFNDKLGLGTGLQFASYRTGQPFTGTQPRELTQISQYLMVPLHLHVNSDPSSTAMGYFYFGPEFHFNTGADIKFNDIGLDDQAKEDFERLRQSLVVGAGMGAGVGINVGSLITIFAGVVIGGTFTDLYTDEAKEAIAISNSNPDKNYAPYSTEGFSVDIKTGERTTTFIPKAGGELGVKVKLFQ